MKKFSKDALIINGNISCEKKEYNCSVIPHCHDFFEFEYIVSGEGTYSIDGIDYEIKKRTLYFLTPANFHSVDMKNTVFYTVMFSADMCNIEILSRLFTKAHTVISADFDTGNFLCILLDELCKNCNNIKYASLILETIITKISVLAGVSHISNISTDIKDVQLYILGNFKKNLTLAQVASRVRLSQSHFSRKFSREVGKSFKEYLDSIRFEYAKKLLIYSDMTVFEICSECGFDDYPNFVRRFKKCIGVSPSNYRKNNFIIE